jgi:hypothetical protein
MRRSKRLVLDRGRRDDAAHEIDHDCARSAGPHVEPEKIHSISYSPFKTVITGSAGALARNEREARTNFAAKNRS